MKRIRICQLITTLESGGPQQYVYDLATRLDPVRFEVQVVGLRGGTVAGELRAAGVATHILNVRHAWSVANPVKQGRLGRLLSEQQFNIIHTHLFHADLAGRLAAKRAGMRHVLHTVHMAEHPFRPWQFAFERRFRRRCDRIICVSEAVRRWHAHYAKLPADRYVVIPSGAEGDNQAEPFIRSHEQLYAEIAEQEFSGGAEKG